MASVFGGLFLFVGLAAGAFGTLSRYPMPHTTQFPLSVLVQLRGANGACSATHVGNGYVLTAAHCADLPVWRSNQPQKTEVAFKDEGRDIAVLQSDAVINMQRARLNCRTPQVDDEVIIAGFPGSYGPVQVRGRVAKDAQELTELGIKRVVGIDTLGMAGMSGSGVFIEGKVAAVFVAGPGFPVPVHALWFAATLDEVCSKLPVPQ